MKNKEYVFLITAGITFVSFSVAILVEISQGHAALRTEIQESERALRLEMQEGFRVADAKTEALRTEMQGSIGELRTEMQNSIGEVRADIHSIREAVNDLSERVARLEVTIIDLRSDLAGREEP